MCISGNFFSFPCWFVSYLFRWMRLHCFILRSYFVVCFFFFWKISFTSLNELLFLFFLFCIVFHSIPFVIQNGIVSFLYCTMLRKVISCEKVFFFHAKCDKLKIDTFQECWSSLKFENYLISRTCNLDKSKSTKHLSNNMNKLKRIKVPSNHISFPVSKIQKFLNFVYDNLVWNALPIRIISYFVSLLNLVSEAIEKDATKRKWPRMIAIRIICRKWKKNSKRKKNQQRIYVLS